jgi:hypothetical protein
MGFSWIWEFLKFFKDEGEGFSWRKGFECFKVFKN